MKLKYYAEVANLNEAVDYYKKLFKGKIRKDAKNGHHALVELFGEIPLLLHKQSTQREKPGYLVIKFSKKETNLFYEAIKIIKEGDAYIEFDITKGGWKTTSFFQFRDKYGHHWVYEINTDQLRE